MKLSLFIAIFLMNLTLIAQQQQPDTVANQILVKFDELPLRRNRPLYILDGKEIQSFDSIQPDDIESITILKDSAATSGYGERGRYGVVLIRGKKKDEPK